MREVVAIGDVAAVRARIAALHDAGVDHVAVIPIGPDGRVAHGPTVEASPHDCDRSPGHGFRMATFDCYGTLVDWEGGARPSCTSSRLATVTRTRGRAGPAGPLGGPPVRAAGRAISTVSDDPGRQPGGLVPGARLRLPGRRRRGAGRGHGLVAAVPRHAPRAAAGAGGRAAAGHRLEHRPGHHGAHAAPARPALRRRDRGRGHGAYKPSDAVFEHALDRLGEAPSTILHVAFGFKYDIGPAQRHGMGTAWINRHVEAMPARRAAGLRVARPVGPRRAGRRRGSGALTSHSRRPSAAVCLIGKLLLAPGARNRRADAS